MNLNDSRYEQYALVNEMMDSVRVIRELNIEAITELSKRITYSKILFTGEGSSRIFPSKKVRYDALRFAYPEHLESEGATQALEYDLGSVAVIAASNSGKTKEVVRLLRSLRSGGHECIGGVTALENSPVEEAAHFTYHLLSGKETAVAATKTVVEQALFYDIMFRVRNRRMLPDLDVLADSFERALTLEIPQEIVEKAKRARTLYWAGRNDGVAEELTLKTNEIVRRPSDFLEGTYAVHGIEEIMDSDDLVVVVQPFEEEVEKFREVLVDGVGLKVVSIGSRETDLPTILIPEGGEFAPYVELAAGWNLLVEIGTALEINLDKAERARKIGNEFQEPSS